MSNTTTIDVVIVSQTCSIEQIGLNGELQMVLHDVRTADAGPTKFEIAKTVTLIFSCVHGNFSLYRLDPLRITETLVVTSTRGGQHQNYRYFPRSLHLKGYAPNHSYANCTHDNCHTCNYMVRLMAMPVTTEQIMSQVRTP